MSQHQRHGASPGKGGGGKDVRQLLARASDLEAKLSSHSNGAPNATAADDSVAQGYRLKVCEVLSDVLLTDPAASLKHDVPGRLWRVCFYQRIGELRGRIQKEASRLQQLKKASSGGNGKTPSTEKRDGLESALKTFLGEAIVLYDYLVDRYEGTLKRRNRGGPGGAVAGGGGRQGRPPPQSKEPAGGGDDREEEEEDPVVVVLYRLLIHRGDLHRYAADYGKSESSYLASSRLRPGMGNPYNQLAVVSQQHREQTVVALYYYARSLCATVEPFEPTSRTNLRRLFVGNRAWYESNRETSSDVYRLMLEEIGASRDDAADGLGDRWSGGGRLARSGEKTRVMRLALSAFVDLHGSLFLAAAAAAADPSCGAAEAEAEEAAASIGHATDSVLSQFSILLSEHCLSDALVLKMVVCNAFAVADCNRGGEGASGGDSSRRRSVVFRAALRLALRFGVILLEQVGRHLERAAQARRGASGRQLVVVGGDGEEARSPSKIGGGGGGRNFRLLGPVVLVADWLRVLPPSVLETAAAGDAGDSAAVQPGDGNGGLLVELRELFYSKLCDTWNALAEANPPPPADEGGAGYGAAGGRILKEHVLVRGLQPFAEFVDQRREASATASGEEEYAIRMERLRRCLVEHGRFTYDGSAGRFLYGVDDADETMMDDGGPGASLTQDEDEEGGGATGVGPSLAFHAGMDETQSPGLLLPPGCRVGADAGAVSVTKDVEADADDVIVYRAPAASSTPAPVVQPVAPMATTGLTLSDGAVGSDTPPCGIGTPLGGVVAGGTAPGPRPPPGFGTPAAGGVLPPPPRPPPGFIPTAGVIGGDVIVAAAVGGGAAPVLHGGGGILRTATDNPFAQVQRHNPPLGSSGAVLSGGFTPAPSSSLFGQAAVPPAAGPTASHGGAVASPSHPLGFELGGVARDLGGAGPSTSASASASAQVPLPANFDFSSLLFDHNAGSLLQPQPAAGAGATSSASMATTTTRTDPWGGAGLNPAVSGTKPASSFGLGLDGGGALAADVDGGVNSASGGTVGWMFERPIATAPDGHGSGGINGAPGGEGRGAATMTNNPFFA